MQSLYYKTYNFIENSQPTHLGIYFSLLLHLSILLFAVGLPDFFKPKTIPMPQVIPIEILNISDVTSLTPTKENTELESKESKKIKQKKFSSAQNTEIQKVELREKPKKNIKINTNEPDNNILPQKSEQKKISLNINEKIQPKEKDNLISEKIETIKENKIKPKLKPKIQEEVKQDSDLKIENKIKPDLKKVEKKIIDKPKPIEKPEPDFNLATMLKDLRNEDIANTIENNENIEEEEIIEKDDSQKINSEVSISEMDLVLQQLMSCFNPRAGTKIVGDEMVKISAKIDREANVRKDTVQIIATNISKNNPYYEAITESALATLYNPLCSKLKLPLNKYESWKDLKITIDYSWIKN